MKKPRLNFNPILILLFICAAVTTTVIIVMGPAGIFRGIFPKYVQSIDDEPLKTLSEPPSAPLPVKEESPSSDNKEIIITLNNIFTVKSFDIIKKNLYNIDRTAYIYDEELDFEKLLSIGARVDLSEGGPKILIFHTHSQEGFKDSREDAASDTIVGVGDELAEILEEEYGIPVLHHKGVYDMADGKVLRDGSYEKMEPEIRRILDENPSIEVLIDLHRDSLPNGRRLVTEIDGKQTAQIMYFNGICRLNENGAPVQTSGLVNDYIAENLALSLRMKLLTNEMYPDFSRKIYIKPYRYSLHMKPLSLLIEVGSDANTVSEAKNAMAPLAKILVRAFS